MKIYTFVRINIDTGEVLEEESFEYDGPIAKCDIGGPGPGPGVGGRGEPPGGYGSSPSVIGGISPSTGQPVPSLLSGGFRGGMSPVSPAGRGDNPDIAISPGSAQGHGLGAAPDSLGGPGFLSHNVPLSTSPILGEASPDMSFASSNIPGTTAASMPSATSPSMGGAALNSLTLQQLLSFLASLAFPLSMAPSSLALPALLGGTMSQMGEGDPNAVLGVAGAPGGPPSISAPSPGVSPPANPRTIDNPPPSYFNRFTGNPLTYEQLMKMIYNLQ